MYERRRRWGETGRARRLPAVLLVLAIAAPAAADPAPGAVTWPAAAYNPHAQSDDLLVPLPCGGALALRWVSTPGPEQGYAVSGAFRDAAGGPALLVGTYEATERQARAIAAGALGGACPEPGASAEAAAERPVLLSFAEALVLSEQVSAWLATHAAVLPACRPGEPGPCLPRVDRAPAALRLPSAAEWEYAARGGDAGSPADAPLLADARLWPLLERPAAALTGVRLVASVPIFTSLEKVRAAQHSGADPALPEPPPLLLTGRLRVEVDRAAQILLDGVVVGSATPDAPFQADIAAGEYRIGVDADGYTAPEQTRRISVHQAGEVRFELRALSAAEREARLALDGAARGQVRAHLALTGHSVGAGAGDFAAPERAALTAFQRAAGLPATGYVDAATRTRLAAEAAAKAKAEAEAKAVAGALLQPRQGPVGDLADTMIEIPGGTFRMGCSPGDGACDGDEKSAHEVRIAPFRMGQFAVTRAQWRAVMGENPSRFTGGDRPVENVSWNDIQIFLERLNAGHAGPPYRLPSEAEWEYQNPPRAACPIGLLAGPIPAMPRSGYAARIRPHRPDAGAVDGHPRSVLQSPVRRS